MKTQNYILYTTVTLFCFILCPDTSSTNVTLEQAIEQQLYKEQLEHQSSINFPSNQNDNHVLKRKRRYLEFPEGSSFQLVYDLIIGVVDFTNYLILGITVALAWELPSKPPSEIFDDLNERLKDGTLGTSRNDTIEEIKYTNHKYNSPAIKSQFNLLPMFRPPMHYQYYIPHVPDRYYKYPNNKPSQGLKIYTPGQYKSLSRKQHNYYSHKRLDPFAKWTQAKTPSNFTVKGINYPWWDLPDRIRNSYGRYSGIRRFDKNLNYGKAAFNNKRPVGTRTNFQGTGRSVHRIFPIFGKRSISPKQVDDEILNSTHHRYRRSGIPTEEPSKLDRIHIQHHRKTRHDLYQRIEIYLNGRGSHGQHCVLRALCETGQKSKEQEPGTFVGELMRAIFTMPESVDATAVGSKELRYDEANALMENCAARYNQCKDSLWSSYFVL